MSIRTIKRYFKNKADQYDEVDKQLYWVFSDELLWFNFRKTLNKLKPGFSFLDVGGGTGRWTKRILETYRGSKGILFDLSEDMLRVAGEKLENFRKTDRLQIIKGDFENLKDIKNLKADVVFNFHNVLGFANRPSLFISNLVQCTNRGGYVISFVPNLYHGLYFNVNMGNLTGAAEILDNSKGKFIKDMPLINFFTPDGIRQLYSKNHLSNIWVTGFPSCLYPNFQETQISGQTISLKRLLSSKTKFRVLLEIEKKICVQTDVAARGNNIYIIGGKES